jgi:hypothetical protein
MQPNATVYDCPVCDVFAMESVFGHDNETPTESTALTETGFSETRERNTDS